MNSDYPHLCRPIKIGTLTLKNRIVAAPSSQGDVNADGTLNEHNIAYYARKARGGCALVTVGDGIVHPTGQDHPRQVLLYTDGCIPSLVRCAEEIHKYNCAASYELSHGGIVCDPAFIGGERPYGPSEVPVTIGFQTNNPVQIRSQKMSVSMIHEIEDAYAGAALRVKKAGFDMVMIHGAHGWIFSQFFSPYTNHRTDEYGGNIENRARFAIETVKKIREAVGPHFPIEFRINGEDGNPEGLKLEESVEICKLLAPYVDSFHVSSCFHMIPEHQDIMQSPIFVKRGHLLHLAAEIKKHVDIPVTSVGGFSDPELMEDAVASGKADIIALGRQTLADPDTAKKIVSGNAAQIKPCQRCATCQSCRFTLQTARCAVNPAIGREYELQFTRPAVHIRKVIIAGGGPGGMEAAIIAAERGHDVTLYEKGPELGGALNLSKNMSFKKDLYRLVESMKTKLASTSAKVILNTAVTPGIAEAEHADVLISALGACPIVPPIPVAGGSNVLMAGDVDNGAETGGRVLVIGGGLVGVESALELAKKGKKVTIAEMLPSIANDANFRYARTYRWEIEKEGVEVITNTRCTGITDEGVNAVRDGKEAFIPADTVVLACGMKPLEEESEALRFCAPVFIPIGSVVRPGVIKDAIRAGFDAAMFLD